MRKKRKYKSTRNNLNVLIFFPSKSILPISQTIKFKRNLFDSSSQKKRLQNQIWKSEEQFLEKKLILNPISTSLGGLGKRREGLDSEFPSVKQKGREIYKIISKAEDQNFNPPLTSTSTEMGFIHPSEVDVSLSRNRNFSPKKDLFPQSQEFLNPEKGDQTLSEKVSLTKKDVSNQSLLPSLEKKQKLSSLFQEEKSSLSWDSPLISLSLDREGYPHPIPTGTGTGTGTETDEEKERKKKERLLVNSELSVLYPLSSEILPLNRNKKRIGDSNFYPRKEETKLSLLYGQLGRKHLLRLGRQAKGGFGLFREKFIQGIESRLDVVVWRLCFWFSLYEIREWIRHRRIRVNNQPVTLSSLQLVAGDIVSLDPSWCQKVQNKTIRLFSLLSAGKGISKFRPDFNQSYPLFHQLYRWKSLSSPPVRGGKVKDSNSASKRDVKNNKNYFYPTRKMSKWVFDETLSTFDLHQIGTKISHLKGDPLFPIRVLPLIYNDEKKDSDRKGRRGIKDIRKKMETTRNQLQPPFSRFSMMKCTHLEISYKTLSAVFLYPPQKVSLPVPIDFDLVSRSLG